MSSRFESRRIIQAGFVLSVVGLVSLMATVHPDVVASETSNGMAAGISDEGQDSVGAAYREERTNAFRAGIGFLAFLGLLGLVISMRLPRGRLVDESAGDDPAQREPEPSRPG